MQPGMSKSKILMVLDILFGATNAHMFISSPTPLEGSAPKNPLDPSGSDFPCHGISLPTSGGQQMAAGSNQTLAFDLGDGANTAVHGGGSCQMSITYETDPAKQKNPASWKVIYSIEGGCPSDTKGNLNNAVACTGDNGPDCVNSFPFTIPKGVKDGHVILAWTWSNTIGNRELYMNCISAEFSGGDGSEMGSFPAMFVANLESVNKCPTTEQVNVKFPNPGAYVTTKTEGNPYPLAVPTGDGCSGGVAPYINSQIQAAPSSNSAVTSLSSAMAIVTVSSDPTASQKSIVASTPSSYAPPTAPSSGSTMGSCKSSKVYCSTPGELICIDDQHFGLCGVDHCTIPQAVAAGTSCQNGSIVRSRKRAHEHVSQTRSNRHFRHRH